jgi:hypothetical protein
MRSRGGHGLRASALFLVFFVLILARIESGSLIPSFARHHSCFVPLLLSLARDCLQRAGGLYTLLQRAGSNPSGGMVMRFIFFLFAQIPIYQEEETSRGINAKWLNLFRFFWRPC